MNTNRITVRYAKALIEAASNENLIDVVYSDVQLIFATICKYSDLENFIIAPGVSTSIKMERIRALFSGQLSDLSFRFVELVIWHGRAFYFKDICRNVISLIQADKNIAMADLELAQPVDKVILDRLKSKFERKIGKQIEMKVVENPSLLGGFIFSFEDEQYDASVRGKLEALRKKLTSV